MPPEPVANSANPRARVYGRSRRRIAAGKCPHDRLLSTTDFAEITAISRALPRQVVTGGYRRASISDGQGKKRIRLCRLLRGRVRMPKIDFPIYKFDHGKSILYGSRTSRRSFVVGGETGACVAQRVSFSIREGEFVAPRSWGTSGSGKSTLLNLLRVFGYEKRPRANTTWTGGFPVREMEVSNDRATLRNRDRPHSQVHNC